MPVQRWKGLPVQAGFTKECQKATIEIGKREHQVRFEEGSFEDALRRLNTRGIRMVRDQEGAKIDPKDVKDAAKLRLEKDKPEPKQRTENINKPSEGAPREEKDAEEKPHEGTQSEVETSLKRNLQRFVVLRDNARLSASLARTNTGDLLMVAEMIVQRQMRAAQRDRKRRRQNRRVNPSRTSKAQLERLELTKAEQWTVSIVGLVLAGRMIPGDPKSLLSSSDRISMWFFHNLLSKVM
jgi:hypothetical protein